MCKWTSKTLTLRKRGWKTSPCMGRLTSGMADDSDKERKRMYRRTEE